MADVPVIIFAYARPAHLKQVLDCLRQNSVPVIHAFADGAKGSGDAEAVAATRAILRAIDWAEVHIQERPYNLGLGRNVISGVSEIAARHEAFIVWEDDLVCTPGTYAWLAAALDHYRSDKNVMSVTAWTHPDVTPANVGEQPYFDGRAECWVWGAWARSWKGMKDETATEKFEAASRRGIAPDAYGADLPDMARAENRRNIWAVRWLYHHLQHGGLCCRPPWNMVEHIGIGLDASNAIAAGPWTPAPIRRAPAIPAVWPSPEENPECREKWRAFRPRETWWHRVCRRLRSRFV
jgi:hypothetical protein